MGETSSSGFRAVQRPPKVVRYSRTRDRALTLVSRLLAKSRAATYYAEAIVLATRHQQAQETRSCMDRIELWERHAIPHLHEGSWSVLEFGVAEGWATRWWASRGLPFRVWHGFDTFDGLPADWTRGGSQVMAAGVFRPESAAPPIVNAAYPVEWHTGLIEETLPGLPRPEGRLLVLVDVDLLAPTRTILAWLETHGRDGDLIYFDEAFDPWNEGMALREAQLSFRRLGHTGMSLLVELGSSLVSASQ